MYWDQVCKSAMFEFKLFLENGAPRNYNLDNSSNCSMPKKKIKSLKIGKVFQSNIFHSHRDGEIKAT